MNLRVASIGAILLGSIYTIFRKYQGVVELSNSSSKFNQPIIQAFVIFVGMSSICLFHKCIPKDKQQSGKQPPKSYVYIVPSLLDVAGTIFDTAGLFYTSVSISQMLKGSVLLFTYIITVLFSMQKLNIKKHIYMVLVIISLFIISCSNLDINTSNQPNPLLGNLLIITSQLLFALMFISQDTISKKYSMNVASAVSWQGIWGVCICGIVMIVFSCFESPLKCDLWQTASVLYHNTNVLIAMIITAICIAPFNYFGLTITKQTSALQRCIICTARMVVVWVVSLKVGWQSFSVMQLFGYILLVASMEGFSKEQNRRRDVVDEETIPIHGDKDSI